MDSGNGDLDGDRLSNLPDDLIHKILALINTKQAVQTSTLSSRWRYIWTSMRDLNFSNQGIHRFLKFLSFVEGVQSSRNNQIELHSVTLTLLYEPDCRKTFKSIMKYAVSHNVRQLNIAAYISTPKEKVLAPTPVVAYLSVTSKDITMTPSCWDLPALTTLILMNVELYDNKSSCMFSNFVNLKNLTLIVCRERHKYLNICLPRLSNLRLESGCGPVIVVTPQLKNLIIKNWERICVTCAPDLASLQCEGWCRDLQLPADLIHLEKVVFGPYKEFNDLPLSDKAKADRIVSLLQQFHSVKCLTLDIKDIEILCSSVELISHQPSPFSNLKSLKIHSNIYSTQKEQTQPEVTMCTEVKNYLLDGSPGATLQWLDVRATKDHKFSQCLIPTWPSFY